jgi:L-ascorbate metabolism protein UlaG (beta-lactamase superfamily)
MMIFLLIVALFIFVAILFMQLPAFGKTPSGKRLQKIRTSPQFYKSAFQNQSYTPALTGGATITGVMKDFFFGKHERKIPFMPLPSVKSDLKDVNADEPTITWFGHSSYLLQLNGRNILVDPVFSERTSPVQFAGTKAFPGSNIYSPDDMPDIDVLLLTHDHYDHLDYNTVAALKDRVSIIVTSLGVGAHLEKWGIATEKIKELDWWESNEVMKDLRFTATPGRHFSGRKFKRNQTLWSAFVLETGKYRLFLGGDSGYDSHFKEIGNRFGSFDLAILECGQYNVFWANIHMMPEETVQAAIDLHAKVLMPVHWAKFALATHPWDDSIKRVVKQAAILHQPLLTPMIGQKVSLNHMPENEAWWEKVN